jgi:nicotinate-nucleotide adenylyltransferase
VHIGLFGGTFNPPHIAHLIVAETVHDRCRLDRVWWIPAATPPHKTDDCQIAPAEHRLEMLRRATADNEDFYVSDVELQRTGVSYTVDTVRLLQKEYDQHSFTLVMGGDMFVDFPSWHRPEEISRRVPLIVYGRPGADLSAVPDWYRNSAEIVDTPLMEISGTDIRHRLSNGRSCRYRVPDKVLSYIQTEKLYDG